MIFRSPEYENMFSIKSCLKKLKIYIAFLLNLTLISGDILLSKYTAPVYCIKILEGIKFYLDNKVNKIKIVKTDTESMFKAADISQHTKAAERAMKNYTERLRKENERYKKQNCTTTS